MAYFKFVEAILGDRPIQVGSHYPFVETNASLRFDRRKAVEDKFRRETRYTLRKERMEKVIDIVHHLEDANAAQVRELARLCCSEKG